MLPFHPDPLGPMKDCEPKLRFLAPLACMAFLLAGCGEKSGGKESQTPTVGVIAASAGPVTLTADLAGRTQASEIAEVRPQVSGIVMERLFEEGSNVRAGQPLYQIDSRLYAASQQQASAALTNAQASVEASRLKAERYRVLAEEGGISKQDAADAIAAYNQARAQVALNRASLASANVSLGFTRVVSPISGRIGRSAVTKGALVTSNQADALAKVQRLDPIWVNIQQSSTDFMALRRSMDAGRIAAGSTPVRIILSDGSEFPIEGKLNFADIDVNEQTGTVTLRATVPNPRGDLLPGLFVRARVGQGTVPDGILVPQTAVTRSPRGTATVLVVNAKSMIETRDVMADTAVGTNWLITSGLKPGEKVVVEGLLKARPGAKVKVVPAGSKAAAQGGGKGPGMPAATRK